MFTNIVLLQTLSIISTLTMVVLVIIGMRMKNKQQIHYAFLSVIFFTLFWSAARLIQIFVENANNVVILEKLVYVGVCLLPISLMMTGIIFAKTRVNFWKYIWLYIVPIITLAIIFSSHYQQLFIIKASFVSTDFEYGPYYLFHEIYSYSCIVIGILYLLVFSIKNSGYFSKQSLLISLAFFLPLSVVIISTTKIVEMPVFWENISFAFSMLLFMIAIFKFDFLNVVPVALQKIVDLISEGYLIVNNKAEIIDFNQTFVDTFKPIIKPKRRENLSVLLLKYRGIYFSEEDCTKWSEAIGKETNYSSEEHIEGPNFNQYFQITITPIFSNQHFLGSIILFQNITEHKKNIEIIKNNQEVLMEKERLASLGQMIGGIAHNLKTPIMSLAGGIEALNDLVDEYKNSVGDKRVTQDDHLEIAAEMHDWLHKMKPYCTYMTDVINAVKGQAVQLNYSSSEKFYVGDLVKRISVLMRHDLKKYHCTLNEKFDIDLNTEIQGEVINLVQVINNIITNAIQAYEGQEGIIDFEITKDNKNVIFKIQDYGKGIPQKVQDRLFKEMLTTKGKNGTGLGLYMSYSTIKGRFFGNMEFKTAENVGTAFIITIPYLKTGQ